MQLLTDCWRESCSKFAELYHVGSCVGLNLFFTSYFHICNDDVLIKEEYFQISMSVLQEHKTAVKMLFATIPKVPITVHVNQDILEMDRVAKVNVTVALIFLNEQGNGN